jgi:hypothetical protein
MTTIRGWIHDRARWVWAVVGVLVLGAAAASAVALTRDGGDRTEAVRDTVVESSTTSTPTTLATSTTTTAPTTSDTAAVPTTTRAAPTTTLPPAAIPGAVTVIRTRPGGGSGEIVVQWDAVGGATGYRVLRSGGADGPYAVIADHDVATRRTTAAEDGITVWSPQAHPGSSTSSPGGPESGGSRSSPTTPAGTRRQRSPSAALSSEAASNARRGRTEARNRR